MNYIFWYPFILVKKIVRELKATLYPKFWRIVKELKEIFELEEF